jgi:hypothetical protein
MLFSDETQYMPQTNPMDFSTGYLHREQGERDAREARADAAIIAAIGTDWEGLLGPGQRALAGTASTARPALRPVDSPSRGSSFRRWRAY